VTPYRHQVGHVRGPPPLAVHNGSQGLPLPLHRHHATLQDLVGVCGAGGPVDQGDGSLLQSQYGLLEAVILLSKHVRLYLSDICRGGITYTSYHMHTTHQHITVITIIRVSLLLPHPTCASLFASLSQSSVCLAERTSWSLRVSSCKIKEDRSEFCPPHFTFIM
jgi:hypothetical protein